MSGHGWIVPSAFLFAGAVLIGAIAGGWYGALIGAGITFITVAICLAVYRTVICND